MSVLKNNVLTKAEVFLLAIVLSTIFFKHSLSSLIMGIFILYSLYISMYTKRKFEIDKNFILPISLYLLFILSVFWTQDLELTFKGLGRTVVLILLPLVFSFKMKISKQQLSEIFNIFSYSNFFFGLIFIADATIRSVAHKNISAFFYHDLVSILDLNAIYVSSFFYISTIFLVFKKNKSKYDLFVILTLLVLIVILSSKVITLITLLSLLFYFIKNKKSRLRLLIIVPISIIILYFTSGNLIHRIKDESQTNLKEVLNCEDFTKVYPWTGTSIRLLQLRILQDQIEEDGILINGFGLFASRKSIEAHHKELNIYNGFYDYNYHNLYAQMLSELGLIGLTILILQLYVLIRLSISKNYTWLSLVSIMFLFWFFTESVLWVQRGLFIFIVIYCIVVKLENNKINSD
jgi:hypothetical protein